MNGILKKTALAVTGFVFLASSASAATTLPTFAPLAREAGPAVVNISTEREVESPVMGMFNFPGMERFFDQFGGPFGGVFRTQLHGIADLAQSHEVDALDGLSVADVEAGDYAFGKHRARSLRVMRPS